MTNQWRITLPPNSCPAPFHLCPLLLPPQYQRCYPHLHISPRSRLHYILNHLCQYNKVDNLLAVVPLNEVVLDHDRPHHITGAQAHGCPRGPRGALMPPEVVINPPQQADGWSTIIPHPVHLTAAEVQDMNTTAAAIHHHHRHLRIHEKGPCRCQRTLGPRLALRASRQIHLVRCAGGRPKFVSIHSVPCRNDVRRATDPAGSVITEPFSLLHIPFS